MWAEGEQCNTRQTRVSMSTQAVYEGKDFEMGVSVRRMTARRDSACTCMPAPSTLSVPATRLLFAAFSTAGTYEHV